MYYGGGILALLILIVSIIVIVQILQSGMPTINKLVWILVILLLPLIGLLLYFVLGRGKA